MVRILRAVVIALSVCAVLVAGAVLLLSDPDIAPDVLEAKYTSAASQFLTLPSGARVHLRDEGLTVGPVLVLLHGSNAALQTWEPWVGQLKNDLRIISLDLPGHGLTGPVPSGEYGQAAMAAFVLETVDALKITQFAVAGNSMGAGVAARIAIDHPARVTKLILVDGGGMPSRQPRDPGLGFQIARLPVINNLMLWISPRSLFADGLRTAIRDDALVTEAMIDLYWELNRRRGNRAASLARFQAPMDTSNAENMTKITAPTLILWGEKDTLIPPDSGEAAQRAIANSTLIIYPNVGHIPQEEVAEKSAQDVRGFLTGGPMPSVETP